MHIALLASDGRSPTEIARVLFCSRTTVYAVVSRFAGEGRAAFDDRRPRGPRPLLGQEANERVEKLLEEDSPIEHGWLRSPASLELQAARQAQEDIPLPQGAASCHRQRLKPSEQTGQRIRAGVGGAHPFASPAFVVSGEQPGGVGVVVSARGRKPQS